MSSSEPFLICLWFLPYQCLTLWPVLAAFELLPLLRLLDKIGQTMRLFPKTHLLESQATRLQMQTHTMFRINKYLYSAIFSFRDKESSIQRNDKKSGGETRFKQLPQFSLWPRRRGQQWSSQMLIIGNKRSQQTWLERNIYEVWGTEQKICRCKSWLLKCKQRHHQENYSSSHLGLSRVLHLPGIELM